MDNPIVLLNPSLGKNAMQRDAVFLEIAKMFHSPVVVFMRGWDQDYFQLLLNQKEKFSNNWLKADAFLVLASEFERGLRQLGVKVPIYLTTTKVSDELIKHVVLKERNEIISISLIARIEKNKGVFIAIDTMNILRHKYPKLQLKIIGEGGLLDAAKKYVSDNGIANVIFTGPLYNEELKNEYKNTDLFLFPTFHGEGMPNSVLEAMAFGLPVITRPVGGLVDFFENDKMGYMLESLDSKDYAEKIEYLINNIDKVNEIAQYNWDYAREHFLASKVAVELEKKIQTLNDN